MFEFDLITNFPPFKIIFSQIKFLNLSKSAVVQFTPLLILYPLMDYYVPLFTVAKAYDP